MQKPTVQILMQQVRALNTWTVGKWQRELSETSPDFTVTAAFGCFSGAQPFSQTLRAVMQSNEQNKNVQIRVCVSFEML